MDNQGDIEVEDKMDKKAAMTDVTTLMTATSGGRIAGD